MATKQFARWYLDTGKDAARDRRFSDVVERGQYLSEKRALRVKYLADAVKNLRESFAGFDSKDGYKLTDLKSWPAARVAQVEKYSVYLRHLQSQPHDVLKPRNKKQKKALVTLTGQTLPRQKAYLVHKPTERDKVKMTRDGVISVMRELPDGKGFLKSDFYLFSTFGIPQPGDWDELYSATAELLPWMPDGMYYLYSSLHGEIDAPQMKKMLLRIIKRYAAEYHQRDFARSIIGYRKVSDEISINKEAEILYKRRREVKRQKDLRWKRLQQQVVRHARKNLKR